MTVMCQRQRKKLSAVNIGAIFQIFKGRERIIEFFCELFRAQAVFIVKDY